MPNPNFDPLYSTNEIYRDTDDTQCLTDDLDATEADIAVLKTGKADINHTHTGYANANHTHSYNDLNDTPTIPTTLPANGGNADTVDGKHASDFATASDLDALESLVGDSSVASQISSAIASKADTNHTHGISGVTGLSSELDSKYEKPSTGIPKTDLASDIQTSLGKADTAIQSLSGYATESYVDNKVANIVDSAPETLNTLNELAAALGDDPNFATTVATQIGGKVDKVSGKDLSSNDYTTTEKNKLAGIEAGANNTIVDSELSTTSTNPVQNKIVNAAISNLNTLVGDTAVSSQIASAITGKADTEHTHSSATTTTAGFMSTADKSKLDGIDAGANNYTLPTAGSTLGGVKTTSTVTSNSGYTACPIISGVPYYKDTNTTYSLSSFGVTATAAELNYTDGVTSNIQTQLNAKAASSHNHAASNITSGTLSSDRLPTVPISKGGTGATTVAGALSNLGNIGNSYISNPANISVARVTWKTIASTTLPAGTYVIVGNHQWGLSSAGTVYVDRIRDENNTYCTIRHFMNGGGGAVASAIIVLAASTTIIYDTYHEHSAAATASGIHLYAVKIK